MGKGANHSFEEREHQSGPAFMSLLARGIEEADELDHAEAQRASESVVDVGSAALPSLLGRAPAPSVGNGQVLECFFQEACSAKCEHAVEDPVLPRGGQFSPARQFIRCEAVNGAALKLLPKIILHSTGSEDDFASSDAGGHLDKRDRSKTDGPCGSVGPDDRFQLPTP